MYILSVSLVFLSLRKMCSHWSDKVDVHCTCSVFFTTKLVITGIEIGTVNSVDVVSALCNAAHATKATGKTII